MKKIVQGETVEPEVHDFWLDTTGYDTWHRGSSYGQHDTPWNAFTRFESGPQTLVVTIWTDLIVKIEDAGVRRRFVRSGGKLGSWRGLSPKHGEEAQANIDRAVRERLPIVGYEALPNPSKLAKDKREVQHFFMERIHKMKPMRPLSDGEFIARLNIEEAFAGTRWGTEDVIDPGWLFELLPLPDSGPHLRHAASRPAAHLNDSALPSPHDDLVNSPAEEEAEEPLSAEKYAHLALPFLVDHVLKQRDNVMERLTYGQVAGMIGRFNKNGLPHARRMGDVLGAITGWLDSLATPWSEEIPYLTTVVVEASGPNEGLPGSGIRGKWVDYEMLSRADKESKVMGEYTRILNFGSRWYEVLALLGLSPLTPPVAGDLGDKKAGGCGGGESDEHRALKAFVASHPELVGAASCSRSIAEYELHSGDAIDVLFQSDTHWVGAEVKSRTSEFNELDFRRGVYQVIKYRSVLEAQAMAEYPSQSIDVKVYLVLETKLPRALGVLAKMLKVPVIEGVIPIVRA